MFVFANNTFLAGLINFTIISCSISVARSVIGVLFNLFGGVFADSFKRKKLLLLQISCVVLLA